MKGLAVAHIHLQLRLAHVGVGNHLKHIRNISHLTQFNQPIGFGHF